MGNHNVSTVVCVDKIGPFSAGTLVLTLIRINSRTFWLTPVCFVRHSWNSIARWVRGLHCIFDRKPARQEIPLFFKSLFGFLPSSHHTEKRKLYISRSSSSWKLPHEPWLCNKLPSKCFYRSDKRIALQRSLADTKGSISASKSLVELHIAVRSLSIEFWLGFPSLLLHWFLNPITRNRRGLPRRKVCKNVLIV